MPTREMITTMNNYRRDESWMGRGLQYHRPRTNLNTFINSFYPSASAFLPSAVLLQLKQYPDISFYQGDIDWDVMRSRTDTVIIRAGQNIWVDTKFRRNYAEAKRRGMRRGIYFFYDDRVDPGKQAALLVSLIKDDLPEMIVYVDWERKYGGAFGGLKNVVAFMQAVEAALNIECGMYTGYWFFKENSNPIANAAQYTYLKLKELWLAFYAPASQVFVPAPWPVLTHWQYGTPVFGAEYGVQTKELDMNYANMTIAEFAQRYPIIAVTEPPPTGGTMEDKYFKVTTSALNIRSSPENLAGMNDIGDLTINDVVHAVEVVVGGGVTWHQIDKIWRQGKSTFVLPAMPPNKAYAAEKGAAVWMVETANPGPPDDISLPTLIITVDSAAYEIVKITEQSVEVRPK